MQGKLSRSMNVTIETAYIFCVNCGERNNIDNVPCICDRCNKMLVTNNEDYCCLCGCEQ